MGMAAPSADADVAALVADIDPRAGPLIITIFGDTIAPRGGSIWLGSLIQLMARFGISDRLVRTAVFRLTRDGWFENHSAGRRSFYDLTEQGRKTFADADRRIYTARARQWDGKWTLVQALPEMPAKQRQKLRDSLKWHGFGQLSPTLMISPHSGDAASLMGREHTGCVVFSARLEDVAGTASPGQVAATAWNLAGLSTAYANLIGRFVPFADDVPGDPAECFILRTMLIHEYRRILLKDPQLPAGLAPRDWTGDEARSLTAALYHRLTPAADRFIADNLECASGPCPDPAPSYRDRFATGG